MLKIGLVDKFKAPSAKGTKQTPIRQHFVTFDELLNVFHDAHITDGHGEIS